jgi:uncharacterized membrane protein
MAPPVGGRPGPVNDTSKLIAALSIVVWPVALFAILAEPYKNEKFVKFHAIQGLAIGLVLTIVSWLLSSMFSMMFWNLGSLGMLGMLSTLLWVLDLAVFIFLAVQAMKAYNGSYVEVPVVYGFVKNYIGE